MNQKIIILHLEDVKTDAEIVTRKLSNYAFDFDIYLVNSKKEFESALLRLSPDVILSDHALPSFNSIEALKMVRERGLRIPFILVTGAVGEEFAVKVLKEGADDYILKDRLERLPDAITNCINKYKAEKTNQEIEQRLSMTIDALKDYAIFHLDVYGRVISWNQAAKRIKGFNENEIIGKSIAIFYIDEDQQNGIPEYNLRMARENGRYESIGWRKRSDGKLFYADVIITALHDERNNLTGYVKVTRDITERMQAEEKIRKSEADLLNIFNRSLDVICTTDEEGRFIKVSSASASIWGYTPEELIGRRYMDLVFCDDIEPTMIIADMIKRGRDTNMFENRFVRKDGSIVPLLWSAHWDDREKIMYSIAKDATEKKRTEQETLTLLHKLQLKNKDLGQFSYMVSHNLRAPIAKILGLASFLKETPDAKGILEKIADETVNLDTVVTDMNTIVTARDASNEKTENIVFYDELKLVEKVLDNLIVESKASIISNFNPEGMQTVKGRFYSILYNLISNALKYRLPEVPLKIYVETTEVNNHICLLVKDNGKGIDLSRHGDKMFTLYRRFHDDDIPGKGIGLNLVKAQVESLGGRVEVESMVNQGCTFKVFFPVRYKSKITGRIKKYF